MSRISSVLVVVGVAVVVVWLLLSSVLGLVTVGCVVGVLVVVFVLVGVVLVGGLVESLASTYRCWQHISISSVCGNETRRVRAAARTHFRGRGI